MILNFLPPPDRFRRVVTIRIATDLPSDLPDPNLQVEHLVLTIDPGQERAVGIHQAAHMNCPSIVPLPQGHMGV